MLAPTPRMIAYSLAALVVAAFVLVGVTYCRGKQSEDRAKAEQRVDTWKPIAEDMRRRAVLAEAERDSANAALARELARPVAPIPTGSRVGDRTTPAASSLSTTVTADSMRRLLAEEQRAHDATRGVLATTRARLDTTRALADRFRLEVERTHALVLAERAARDSLTDALTTLANTPKPRRRWGLGCSGGYGAVLAAGAVRVGPAIGCGVTFSL